MNNTVRINAEEHKYWNSDSADYWVSQKTALDQLLEPWARLLVGTAQLSGGEQSPILAAVPVPRHLNLQLRSAREVELQESIFPES